mmetsp:Transcript_19861/g.28552  ORF Transcript_19861/g.28552 Transcript_19861/m.28552 type:complete len:308 (+) Transcript_19861:60-983(+)
MIEFNSENAPRRSFSKDLPPIHVCGIELSNQFLLRVAAFSFLLFVVAEIIGALASNSLSLLGDAGAMSVDVFTYFCNMYSEHVKATRGSVDNTTRFVLEVGVPTFSITALLAVTAWITYDAVLVLMDPDADNVNVYFLYGFASGNALVDIICAVLFYLRRRDVLQQSSSLYESFAKKQASKDVSSTSNSRARASSLSLMPITNLNMASALTHVGGDTLRTGAVFIAAAVASATNVKGAVCDAWAAIVVTITIVFLVVPLTSEIWTHAKSHPFLAGNDVPEERPSEVATEVSNSIHQTKTMVNGESKA